MAPPRCRTATATRWRACSAAAPPAVVLKEGNTGGGFGIRGELYPEDFLVCLAALRLGRPVKWIEDRREHLMAANHSRQQRHHARAAVDAEGRMLALEDEFYLDQGAYVRTHGARVLGNDDQHAAGALPHPGLSRRRPFPPDQQDAGRDLSRARPLRGHLCARAADGCGRRPARPRPDRGAPPQSDHRAPRCRSAGRSARWAPRSSTIPATTRCCSTRRWRGSAGRRCRPSCAAAAKPANWSAPGIAIFVEKGGLGPADGTRVSVDTTGAVELVTGGSNVGQGFATAMAQICADTLGVDYRRVRVVLRPDRPHRNTASARMPRALR